MARVNYKPIVEEIENQLKVYLRDLQEDAALDAEEVSQIGALALRLSRDPRALEHIRGGLAAMEQRYEDSLSSVFWDKLAMVATMLGKVAGAAIRGIA